MEYRIGQIVHAAAVFSLADHAARGPVVPETLALEEGLNSDACHRFLHACTAINLLSHQAGTFGGTTLLATLSSDAPSLRGLALSLPGPGFWSPWGRFTTALRTGKNQASATLGSSVFEYYVDHPEEAVGFASTLRQETDAFVYADRFGSELSGGGDRATQALLYEHRGRQARLARRWQLERLVRAFP